MKKTYIVAAALVLTFGLIALRPEQRTVPQTAQPSATSNVAAATTSEAQANAVPSIPSGARAAASLPAVQTETPTSAPNVTIFVEGISYPVYAAEGATVLDAMREAAASSSLAFSGREYPSLGFFIESVNGKENADGFYWFLYLNGASSDTGASQTLLHPGDSVEWKYKRNY